MRVVTARDPVSSQVRALPAPRKQQHVSPIDSGSGRAAWGFLAPFGLFYVALDATSPESGLWPLLAALGGAYGPHAGDI